MASGGASTASSMLGLSSDPSSAPLNGLSKLKSENILRSTPGSGVTTPGKTTICVFCGSSPGKSPAHMEAARALAHAFHKHNISLCYGGGSVGLMGEVARTLVSLSGPESVHGVIPEPLVIYERGPESTTSTDGGLPEYNVYGRTTVVKDMHTRKQLMAKEVIEGGKGSGFVALSGGYGTLEELMEMVTWNQLGIHDRGIVVFNVEGYWDGLMKWVDGAVGAGFVSEGSSGIVKNARDAEEVVELLRNYTNVAGRFKLSWGNE